MLGSRCVEKFVHKGHNYGDGEMKIDYEMDYGLCLGFG